MTEIAIVILFILGVAVVGGVFFFLSKKTKEAWMGAAEHMNLSIEQGGLFSNLKWQLAGTHQNRQVEVYVRTEKRRRRRNGKNTTTTITFTGAKVQLDPVWSGGPDVRMVGMASKALGFIKDKVMGKDEEQSNNQVLGSDFKITGTGDEQVMARLRDSSVAGELQHLKTRAAKLEIEHGWLTFEARETFRDTQDIVAFVEDIIKSAAKIDGGQAQPQAQAQAAPAAVEASGF